MTIDATIHRIRAYRDHRGWTRNRLATEAGVPESILRDMDDPEWSVTVKTLRRLESIIPGDFEPGACSFRGEAA